MGRLHRRQFLRWSLAVAGSAFLGPSGRVLAAPRADILDDPALDLAPAERERQRALRRQGFVELAPVLAAAPAHPTTHLGWPVATRMPGGRVVLAYTRKDGHHGPEDLPGAGRHVLYSDDLHHWHASEPSRIGPHEGMHCIGAVTHPGVEQPRLLLITSAKPARVYWSDDGGVSWRWRDDAFGEALDGAVHVGPNLVHHRDFGVVAAFGQETGGGRRNYLVSSQDAGDTWRVRVWNNRAEARSVEPAMASWGPGHLVMITREWRSGFALGPGGYGHTQHVYRHAPGAAFERVRFTTARTNIVGNPAAGLGCHDTAEAIFNPRTGRIETLQSHRWGGGPGRTGTRIADHEDQEISSLNLWSIDPEALLTGEAAWRFDATLLERIGYSRRGNKDGLHPGGSVVDAAQGVQHIFVYAGWRRSPSHLYRTTRSLDTDGLRAAAGAGG